LAPKDETARLLAELAADLAEDVHNLDRLATAVRQLAGSAGPHAALLLALTGTSFEEADAADHWRAVRKHRAAMEAALGRPLGLRAALLDYLIERNRGALCPDLIDVRLRPSGAGRGGVDPLTGLLTRESLGAHLQQEVLRAKRFQTGFSVLVSAVDALEDLGRELGELNAELIQREVALLLSNTVRDIDPAARLGAGKFGVLMPETDRTGAFLAADRLRRRVAEHFAGRTLAGRRARVTVSGGIACFPEDAGFGGELMQRAEQALHHARSRGADRISVHYRDRREYIRIEIDPALMRIDVVERGQKTAAAPTDQMPRNISPQGVLFESARPFAVGQEVSVICSNLRDVDQVALPARVLRVEELEAEDEARRYEVGLAFELTWEHQVQEILEFIDRFRSPDVR
jgi:diguanylate cyclase (GGDEF)-like protein